MSSRAGRGLTGMTDAPVTLAMPIADRAAALAFYRDALGLEPFGEPGSDGIPEPLRLAVNEGLTLMLVPTTGFGCDALVARARAAGADVVVEPGAKPWGYVGTFADLDGHLWSVVAGTSTAAG